MFKKMKRFKLLVVIFFLQLTAILTISLSYELVALTGQAYRFKIEGYDPVDPMRGRYLSYQINTETIRNDLGDYTGKCYITIMQDKEGYAYLDRAYKERPKKSEYITAKKYGRNEYQTSLTQYYMNEAIAQKAEKLFRDNPKNSSIVIKVKNGKSIVEGLYIGNHLIDEAFQ